MELMLPALVLNRILNKPLSQLFEGFSLKHTNPPRTTIDRFFNIANSFYYRFFNGATAHSNISKWKSIKSTVSSL